MVINEVIPANNLENITHKIDVMNDLLAQSVDKYGMLCCMIILNCFLLTSRF